jgi:hypothetical protein
LRAVFFLFIPTNLLPDSAVLQVKINSRLGPGKYN